MHIVVQVVQPPSPFGNLKKKLIPKNQIPVGVIEPFNSLKPWIQFVITLILVPVQYNTMVQQVSITWCSQIHVSLSPRYMEVIDTGL